MAQAVATYRFDAAQAGDLSFEVGDNVTVIQQNNTGWWLGRTDDGREGIFPFNRVQLVNNANQPPPAAPMVDRINQCQVKPVEPITNSATQEYNVQLVLSNGQSVHGVKKMMHFRVLNHALNALGNTTSGIGAFYKSSPDIVPEIPEWADNVKISQSIVKPKMRERAAILSTFLNYATGDPSFDFLIVYWCDPNSSFSLTDQEKRRVADLYNNSQLTVTNSPPKGDPEIARAVYAWVKRDEQEISFQKGEIIAVNRDTQYTGWWSGEKFNGGVGLFPYNYVAVLPLPEAAELLHNSPKSNPVGMQRPASLPETRELKVPNTLGIPMDDAPLYNPTLDVGFTNPQENTTARARMRMTKYSLCCTEAFDELLQFGVTIEENGALLRYQGGKDCPKRGDTVILLYSGFIWSPQKQELLEFASSDKLISPGGKPADSAPLQFTIGGNEAIDGIEEAVQRMKQGQQVRATLTPDKAYGDVGYPPDIPGNAYLVYDLTLREIKRGHKAAVTNMQGIAKSSIQPRQIEEPYKGFMGSNSMRQMSQSKRQVENQANKTRLQNFGGSTGAGGVDSETFKKKLTLVKLQDIVQRRQYTEYGINPAIIEEYLTDEEFSAVFKVDHFTWLLMPAYKRKQHKQQAGLF